jgi:hypothetical protein
MDMDYSEAYNRLNVDYDFMCEEHVESPTRWNCRNCKYYYQKDENEASYCLKRDIRDWMLYRMDCEGK